MKVLIGNTGLIGQTIKDHINFDLEFNSSNIESIKYYTIDGCNIYLSCLPATKWLVNQDPVKDYNNILNIYNIISKYKFNKIILFSTIDVYYNSPLMAIESFKPHIKHLNYGSNRLIFELLINNLDYQSIQIFRLPSLFGNRIKKNILFDLLNDNQIEKINFNSKYQWLNLQNLYSYMIECKDLNGIINLFPEPIDSIEIAKIFKINIESVDDLNQIIYNYKTMYSKSGYIQSKNDSLLEIKRFISEYRNKSATIR
jgi:hypothetical protein